jgi:hypothetical protein
MKPLARPSRRLLEASAEATDKSPSSLVVYRTREPEVHCAGE